MEKQKLDQEILLFYFIFSNIKNKLWRFVLFDFTNDNEMKYSFVFFFFFSYQYIYKCEEEIRL